MDSIDIIYEEGPVLACNKPSGLLTQAPEGIDSLEARVKAFLIERENKPGGCYLGVPHRLDRPASGVIVFAKHVRAARRISDQIAARLVKKTYWALVSGTVPEESGTWTDYMHKIPGRAESEILSPIHPSAREAILHFQTRRRLDTALGPVTWLEITLETGRTHQIRLQTSSRGFPILGDTLYGSAAAFGPQYEDERQRAIALHSRTMVFTHPMSSETIELTAPVSPAWKELIPTID